MVGKSVRSQSTSCWVPESARLSPSLTQLEEGMEKLFQDLGKIMERVRDLHMYTHKHTPSVPKALNEGSSSQRYSKT